MPGEGPDRSLAVHTSALSRAVNAGRAVPAGKLYGLPELPEGNCWVDMAGVAALTGVPPKTITSWLTRGGPTRNPFPAPRRLLYRLYWPKGDIDTWKRKEQEAASSAAPSRRLRG